MNIALFAFKNIKDDTCLGCRRCLTGFDWKEGEFVRYKDEFVRYNDSDAGVRAFLHCGGCPGTSPVPRLVAIKSWMAPMEEAIDAVHIGYLSS